MDGNKSLVGPVLLLDAYIQMVLGFVAGLITLPLRMVAVQFVSSDDIAENGWLIFGFNGRFFDQ